MADNFTTPVPSGSTFGSDDVGGVHYPRNKIGHGADGSYTDVSSSSPLPVSDSTAATKLDAVVAAISDIPAGGDATAANQVIANEALADIAGLLGGPLAVTGAFFPETQPVSLASAPLPAGAATDVGLAAIAGALSGDLSVTGEFYPATQPVSAASLPLPTGASTEAKQDDVLDALDASSLAALVPFPITPGSGALSRPIKALAIATGGTVIFTPVGGGGDVTLTLPAGLFPLPTTHVKAGGTAEGLTGW